MVASIRPVDVLPYDVHMGGRGSGGARTHGGFPPDPNALTRQRDGKEWTKLPAAGRLGEPPEWPLAVLEPNEEELLKWRELWSLPQALIWEMDKAHDLVAFYVRTYLEGMQRHAGAQARTFVRQVSNDLFLTPMALAHGRYVIDGTDEARAIDAAVASHTDTKTTPKRTGGARNRPGLTVVQPPEPVDDADDDDDDDQEGEIPY